MGFRARRWAPPALATLDPPRHVRQGMRTPMQATSPLPATVRAMNAVGRSLRRFGVPLVSLDEEALLAAARKRTRLADFGPETFREGMRRLIRSLEDEADLSTLGRFIARTEFLMFLENRLR